MKGGGLKLSLSLGTPAPEPQGPSASAEREHAPGDDGKERRGHGGRRKLRLSKQQSVVLEEAFKQHHILSPKEKKALAEELDLRPRQVEVWFQNRRARKKVKKTVVDYETLKRCCEKLSIENQRLHHELVELRAAKCRDPIPLPPATRLSICPSCEKAGVAPPTTATADRLPLHQRSSSDRSFDYRHALPLS